MNEEIKPENMRIHSRADELIACLEGEIAKRDAWIVELESDLAGTQSRVLSLQDQWRKLDAELAALKAQYQRDVYGLNNEGDPIGGEPAGGYANDNARLRAELAAIKAQEPVEYQQLSRYENWDRVDKAVFKLGLLSSTPERFRALYAAPVSEAKAQGEYGDAYQGADEGRRMGGKHCSLTIDQQAQRIGELASHLEFAVTMLTVAGLAGNAQVAAMRAALSAGKEGE